MQYIWYLLESHYCIVKSFKSNSYFYRSSEYGNFNSIYLKTHVQGNASDDLSFIFTSRIHYRVDMPPQSKQIYKADYRHISTQVNKIYACLQWQNKYILSECTLIIYGFIYMVIFFFYFIYHAYRRKWNNILCVCVCVWKCLFQKFHIHTAWIIYCFVVIDVMRLC